MTSQAVQLDNHGNIYVLYQRTTNERTRIVRTLRLFKLSCEGQLIWDREVDLEVEEVRG